MFDTTLLYKYVNVVSIENFEGKTITEIYEEIIEMQKDMVEMSELEKIDELEAERVIFLHFSHFFKEK